MYSKKPRFLKLKMIWNIIRGRPVMYKIKLDKGIVVVDDKKTIICSCIVICGISGEWFRDECIRKT